MFIIEAQNGTHKWISGVFLGESDANAFLDSIPDEFRGFQRLYAVPFASYPVYMIESDGFRFMTRDDAIQAIRCIERSDSDEYVYFNLYRFSCDYAPPKPGTDYMGSITHHHIDNLALDDLQSPTTPHFQDVFPESRDT